MRITEKLLVKKRLISFEIFPPKASTPFDSVEMTMRELAAFNPDFISVTYGAGGDGSYGTEKIAEFLKNRLDTTALAHLTCINTDKSEIHNIVNRLKENNVDNILALRGDLPTAYTPSVSSFKYACELIQYIKEFNSFDIGGACYPEGHSECCSLEKDIENLKYKVNCGTDFLISQMFYSNDVFLSFLDKIRKKGIEVPVFAGIMPITNYKQVERIVELSGAQLPSKVNNIINKYKDNPTDLKKAGIDFAVEQINDLIDNGVEGIHIYTMNKPFIAKSILKEIPVYA